ncbi:MAG: DUF6946 family protein [Cypionkella sp.]
MSKIFVPTQGPEDWRRLLAGPEKHWRRGYSAMAAALSWEAAKGLPAEIRAILGLDAELLLAIPEHKVALPGGQRESQCDVFALVKSAKQTCAVAIEAKVNETFGPTIGEWMLEASSGKITRLTAVCEMLGAPYPPPPNLRYQLFHRTAAAVVEANRFMTDAAAMVVHSFSQEHRWFDDFGSFSKYIGLNPSIGEAMTKMLPNGKPLTLGWATGDPRFLDILPTERLLKS